MFRANCSRRELMQVGCGLIGLSLPQFLGLRSLAIASNAADRGFGRAKSCIVLFCWGGASHLELWDPKPDAPLEVRGEFRTIAGATPGVRLGEHIPRLAGQTSRLAIIRSMHHHASAHGRAMYWNLTGHPPPQPDSPEDLAASRQDWPSLGSVVAQFRQMPAGLPAAVQVPYPMIDTVLQAGQTGGWLGLRRDPVVVRTARGRPFSGVSRDMGVPVLQWTDGVDQARLQTRQALARHIEANDQRFATAAVHSADYFRRMAEELLLNPRVQAAFDLDREPLPLREAYGDHICGQSVLLARRLIEVGVPLITVVCSAGDLNGGNGEHWDTHRDNFNRLKNALLPPLDQASAALLNDLADRGLLEETLVVWLSEFGRTPRINRSAGRDHYPNCYSVALAGGGVRGGEVYGRSDRHAATPLDNPCSPNDLHATIFHALGIAGDSHLRDHFGRPFVLTDGHVLPLFE
jgi:uncharacterized protein (DUF1501 family)